MDTSEYKEEFKQMREKFPGKEEIIVGYYGAGDSFDDFTFPEGYNLNPWQDLLFAALDNSEANFNNGGSEGTITLNLIKETIEVDNNFMNDEYNDDYDEEYPAEDEEEEEEEDEDQIIKK